ncbi:TPA: hypothetical protein QC364_000780 [Bacillus cereus]|nr:hypothetical protein [Bacillus cereus]
MELIGNAVQCLKEAEELYYAYFTPELDNFEGDITVEKILYKVSVELNLLDEGELRYHAEGSEYKYNTNRNKAWRKKCVAFLNKWADEAGDNAHMYRVK